MPVNTTRQSTIRTESRSTNTLGLGIKGRSEGWTMKEGFMEEVAMSLEIWEDVEKGRRGWEREEFHASKTADVQGQRRRASVAGPTAPACGRAHCPAEEAGLQAGVA